MAANFLGEACQLNNIASECKTAFLHSAQKVIVTLTPFGFMSHFKRAVFPSSWNVTAKRFGSWGHSSRYQFLRTGSLPANSWQITFDDLIS